MSKTFSDKAIILKRTNFGEADRILSVLTENHGKLSVKARGVRKITAKLAGAVELFCLSELFLAQGKKFYVLAGAKNIYMYPRVREDFEKMAIACSMLEMVERNLKELLPHSDIFWLLAKCLERLNLSDRTWVAKHKMLKAYFVLNLLRFLGYEPQLSQCAHCHGDLAEGFLRFSLNLGGLLCENCSDFDREAFPVSVLSIKVMRLFLREEVKIIDRIALAEAQIEELVKITNFLLMYRLEAPVHAERFAEKMKVVGNRV